MLHVPKSAPLEVALETFELYANLSPLSISEADLPPPPFFQPKYLYSPTEPKPGLQGQAVLSQWEKADENPSHRGVKSLMMNTPLSVFILKEIVWRGYWFTQRNGFLILEFR